ncbi:MAG: hypothetical protein V5A44_01625 [Haloarculaceae archaeon]
MSPVRTVVPLVIAVLVLAGLAPVSAVAGTGPGSAGFGVAGGDVPDATVQETPVDPAADPQIVQTVEYRLLPNTTGRIGMTIRYDPGTNVSSIVTYGAKSRTLVQAHGFEQRRTGRWVWTGGTRSPSLSFLVTVNGSGPAFQGLGWVDAGEWALARPRTAFAYRNDSAAWQYSWQGTERVRQRSEVDGVGVAGSSVVYLGPHETTRANLSHGTLRVVKPEAANMSDVGPVVGTIRGASEQLDVGDHDRRVNVFVAPSPLRDGGLAVGEHDGSHDLWVSDRRPVAPPHNTWVHEYLHTRQSFEPGPGMRWFTEASATYYAGLLSVRQGLDGRRGFERFLSTLRRNRSAEVVLANRSDWDGHYTPYSRGARTLAALDARIRDDTGGNHTLQDVFRRMNGHDGTVTLEDFDRMVTNVSGRNHSAWLDAHVAGSEPVTVPADPFAYTAVDGGDDADADGLTAAEEREAGTHPFDVDSDGDGLSDSYEVYAGTDPTSADTDGDGIADGVEVSLGSNPTNSTGHGGFAR